METKLQKNIELYISLVYSEKSELNAIENLEERQRAACEKLKLDYKSTQMQDIIKMKDKAWREKIINQLIIHNSNEYTLLLAESHFYTECIQALMEPMLSTEKEMDFKTKSLISKSADELLERMKPRYLRIFKGEAEASSAQEKIRSIRHEDRLKSKDV